METKQEANPPECEKKDSSLGHQKITFVRNMNTGSQCWTPQIQTIGQTDGIL